ncbi:phage baseplate assembly protein V [Stenotrophomonas sp. NY11291]|uniref:phage baseplate assembly protein V n=1 Tax=Stenotrophomonas sp. NY11291 TaxID=2939415 RepID=UPI0020103F69|nr:phage baseplate assembly protein V [Stenotrophomonas sp. NY11291]UQA22112.1 phage baseplate assembly protein V [Stenotrophomonas sp. NY11291]
MDSALPQQINNLLRDGVVTEVDHARHMCRVQTGEAHTDFLPWFSAAAGELRTWAPPSSGEQVALLCCDGDLANAIVLRGLYCEQYPAPSASPSLTLIQFKDGAVVSYDHDAHSLAAVLPAGGTVAITADGGTTITGPVTIKGATSIEGKVTITGKAEVSDDVIAAGISLTKHKHAGVQPGSGTTGAPA